MSAIEIFRLRPGQWLLYQVRAADAGISESLVARIRRGDGAQASDLEIELRTETGGMLSRGRIAIDSGYLAVLREVRRQIASAGTWQGGDIELALIDAPKHAGRLQAT